MIRKNDEYLSFDDIDKLPEEQIDEICFKRGIEINKQDLHQKKEDLKLWLSISNQRNVVHSLCMYTRIHDFIQDHFEIGDDENQEEVLRRVSCSHFSLILLFRTTKTPTISRRCEYSKTPLASKSY